MDTVKQIVDIFLHLDAHLSEVIRDHGAWTYLILSAIVFCETGLVVTPFLPGDSLLFAAGAFAARGALSVAWLCLALSLAAVLGNTVNYWVGRFLGHRLLGAKRSLIRPEHLARTHEFFGKYGAKTIVITRFTPILRTIAPFVAGLGEMSYLRFMVYNVIGGVAWVLICTFAGYFFGNLPFVQKHFSLVVLAIVAVSMIPAVVEALRARRGGAAASDAGE